MKNSVNKTASYFLLSMMITYLSAAGQKSTAPVSQRPGATAPVASRPSETAEQAPVDPERQIMSPLDVKDADIQDVIRTISKGYNLNIVLDKEVSGKVTVHLSDVPIIEGLRTLAKSNGYEIVKEGNVYRIRKAIDEQRSIISFFKGKLTVDVQNVEVKDLLKEISAKTATSIVSDNKVQGKITGKLYQVELDDGLRALLEGNGFEINKRKNIYQVSMGQESSGSAPSTPMGRGMMRSPGNSNFYVDMSNGRLTLDVSNGNLQDVLKAIAQKSDMQIVTYGTIMGEINAKLKDIPLTEALALLLGGTMFTFVQKDSIILIGDRNAATPSGQALSKSELIQLKCIKADGVMQVLPKNISPSNVRVIKEQNALLVSGTSEDIVSMREFIATIDIPTPQVSIDAMIVEYKENMQKDFGVNAWTHLKDGENKSFHTFPSPTVGDFAGSDALTYGGSGADIKAGFKSLFGLSDNSLPKIIKNLPNDFFMIIRILETQDKAKVWAQPSVVTLNGNKATINVNETQYFKITTGSAVLGSDYSIRFQPITFGIKLDITPWISQGGQITAEIAPELSNSDGNNTDGYPNVSTRTIATTVRLNDGETIILGGLIKTAQSEGRKKVPFLGDIPLIGALFRSTTKQQVKSNLVVYITPHILTKGNAVNIDSSLHNFEITNGGFLNDKLKGGAVKTAPLQTPIKKAEPDSSFNKTDSTSSEKRNIHPLNAMPPEEGVQSLNRQKSEPTPGTVPQHDSLQKSLAPIPSPSNGSPQKPQTSRQSGILSQPDEQKQMLNNPTGGKDSLGAIYPR